MWFAKALHCFSEEFQRRFAITTLRDKIFQNSPFVINGPPEVVRLAINLYKNLVQMPLPIRMGTHPTDKLLADLGGEQRAKSVPPKPHSLMAYFDPALILKYLNGSRFVMPKRYETTMLFSTEFLLARPPLDIGLGVLWRLLHGCG